MNAREMYNFAKANGCIYSDQTIKQKIRNLGSVKRWESITVYSGVDGVLYEIPAYYNRVDRYYINVNFEKIVKHGDEWMTEDEWNARFQVPLAPTPTSQEEVIYFDNEEMARLNSYRERILRFYPYGGGDYIYDQLGIFRNGSDDNSPTIGFEIETNMELGCHTNHNTIAQEYLDYRLGHVEADGTINGVEFNSHIFTWNKLKKIKPLIENQLKMFVDAGLAASTRAGLHIHIGRTAFRSEQAFQKFYYLVNVIDNRSFWQTIARRNATQYCEYRNIEPGNVNHVLNSINRNRNEHGRAVNQEHTNTYEIRIFQSTLSADILYGSIELLLKLVDICNDSTRNSVRLSALLNNGIYVGKLATVVNVPHTPVLDLSIFEPMTNERCQELVSQALQAGDTGLAMQYIQRLQIATEGGNR